MRKIAKKSVELAQDRFGMRILQASLAGLSMFLVVEASSREDLSRAMQGLGVRVAKRTNLAFDTRGRVFAQRYAMIVLPREAHSLVSQALRIGTFVVWKANQYVHDPLAVEEELDNADLWQAIDESDTPIRDFLCGAAFAVPAFLDTTLTVASVNTAFRRLRKNSLPAPTRRHAVASRGIDKKRSSSPSRTFSRRPVERPVRGSRTSGEGPRV
jgi:hypothetical protein